MLDLLWSRHQSNICPPLFLDSWFGKHSKISAIWTQQMRYIACAYVIKRSLALQLDTASFFKDKSYIKFGGLSEVGIILS
jgi:hypothetical protein